MKKNDDELVQLLKQLVEHTSIYPNEHILCDFLFNYFEEKGLNVQKQFVEKNRYNLIVQKGNSDSFIGLYAHLDTVSSVTGWKKNAFELSIEGDLAYGLGTYDMKGGMAVNILTFLRSEPKHIGLKLLLCVDEENISKGGYALSKSEYIQNIQCILSPEPAFMHETSGIVTGRIGRCVFDIELTTQSKHFMFYSPTTDLSLLLSQFGQKLSHFYSENGERRQFAFLRLIQSTTIGMSIPEKIIAEVDCAVLSPLTNTDVLHLLQKSLLDCIQSSFDSDLIKAKVSFKKRETPFLSAYELSPDDGYLHHMSESITAITESTAVPYFRSSVADENIFGALGISVLGVGPAGGNAHSTDEFVSLSSLEKLHAIYMHFISRVDTV